MGTEKSKGTKVFALGGKISNTGLVEVPMGTTLREIIYEIGGGCPNGKKFKAAQTGGPSGGCIPASHLDVQIDYDNLIAIGSMMGSGGMIVMDEDTCMVDIARFFLDFTVDETCGKCTPCRIGTKRMLEILDRIADGRARTATSRSWRSLPIHQGDGTVRLGQTAPNPVLSTLKYFRHEYEAHIYEKRCPAGRLQEAADLPDLTREVQGLHAVRARLPGRLHHRHCHASRTVSTHEVPQVRRLHGEVQVRRDSSDKVEGGAKATWQWFI